MRLFLILSVTLASLMMADGQMLQTYQEVCPRYNGVIGDISNGQNVRYLCDTHALVYDKVNLKRGSTVRDCALHCLATPGCLSSMFKAADNVCFVSNQTQATARVPGFVYMLLEKRGTDSGPQPQLGCEEEKKRIQDCERNLKDTQDKLDKLQGQPGQHDPRTPDCDSWRDACIRPCDRSNLAVHGIEYEKRCLAKPRNTIFYQTNTHKSPTECLAKECSGKSDCIGIQWVKTNGPTAKCWVHSKKGNQDFSLLPSGRYNLLLKKGA